MATLDQLYRQVLGRAPDTEGYEYWAREFGPTIEPDEVQTFLRGAVASGEAPTTSALQSQAQTFLSSIPVTPVLTGATTADVAGPPVSASSGSLRNTAEQIVRNAFQDVLGRQPLQGGLDYWTNELLNNPAKTATIAQDIAYGAQGADQTAADRWAQQNLGKSIFAVPTTQDTTKTTTNTSTGLSQRAIAEQMVRDAYQDVLGRQPLPDGLNYWVNEILEGRSSGESLSQNIAYGAQNPADMEAASAWFKRSGIGTQPPVDTTGTVTDTGTTTDTGAQPSLVPTGAANQGLATPNQVRAMYLSMLNREPDQAGYQYWTNQPIENLRQTFLNASVPEMTRRVAEIPVSTKIPKPLMGTTPPGAANVSVEIPGQFVTTDQGAPKPLTVDISKMAPEQQALTNLIAARMPRASAPAAGPIFTPGEVSAQLELERLKAMNAPATPAETPVAGFAQGGLVGNDINQLLRNQQSAIQRESQSRQMLNTMGAPPVKKFSDGGPAGSPSSGVRRLKMSGYEDGGDVADEMFTGTPPSERKLQSVGEYLKDVYKENIPIHARVYLETLLGKKDPITAEDFTKEDLADIEKLLASKPAKGAVTKYADYGKVRDLDKAGRVTDDWMENLPSVGKTLGRFTYETTPDGKRVIKDTYDFYNTSRALDVAEFEQMKPAEKALAVLKKIMADRSVMDPPFVKRAADVLGEAYIGRDGRPVELEYDPKDLPVKREAGSPSQGEISDDAAMMEMFTGTLLEAQGPSPVDTAVSDYIKFQSKALTDPKAYLQALGENIDKYHGKPLREDPEKYLMEQLGPGALAGTIKKAGGEFLPYIEGFSKSPEDVASNIITNRLFHDEPGELHNWLKTKLPRYIRNQLGTAEDPLVRLTDENVEKAIKQLDAYDRRIIKLQDDVKKREAEFGPGSAAATKARLDDEIEASENFLEETMTRLDRGSGYSPERFEEDVLRANVKNPAFQDTPDYLARRRKEAGFPEQGTARTYLGRRREDQLDEFLTRYNAEKLSTVFSKNTGSVGEGQARKYLDQLGQDTEKPLYGISSSAAMSGSQSNLVVTMNHVMDELNNAMRAGTDLPPSLQIKPENLNQFDIDRAVRHVNKIDEWRLQQSRGADLEGGMKSAAVYKEYQDSPKGLRWVQLKADESLPKDEARKQLQEALDREGNIMGHCVGLYCDPVLEGRTEIYSLRDSKGKSHVTIEVNNSKNTEIGTFLDEVPGQAEKYGFTKTDSRYGYMWTYPGKKNVDVIDQPTADEIDKTIVNSPEFKQWLDSQKKQIRQIKGKGNDKQKDAYTPYVQDFVRTGNWDINNIGDFENTDLVLRGGKLYTKEEEAARIAAEMARVEPLIAEAKEFILKDPVFDFIRKANKKRFDMSFNDPGFRRLEDIERFDLTPDGYTLSNIEAMLDDPMAYVDRGQTVLDVYQRVLAKIDEIKSNLPTIQKAAEKYGPEVDRYAAGGEVTAFIKRQAGSPPEGEISNDEFIKSLGDRSRSDLATIKEAIAEIGKNKDKYAFLESKGFTPTDIEDPVKNAAYGLFLTSKTSEDPQRFLSTLSPFYDSKIEFDYTTDRSTLGEVQPYSTEARVYTTDDRGVALHELVHTLQMRQAKDIAEGKKEINQPMSRTVGDKVFQRAADLAKKGEITFPATNWKQDKGELMANVYDMSRKYEEAGKDFTKSIEFKKLFPDEESQLYYYTQTLPDTSVVYPAGSSFEPLKTRDKSKSYARQLLGFAAGGEVTDFIKRVA